jgi:hypothetical protein
MDQGQQETHATSKSTQNSSSLLDFSSFKRFVNPTTIYLSPLHSHIFKKYGHHTATLIEKKYGDSFNEGITVRLINPELFGPIGELLVLISYTMRKWASCGTRFSCGGAQDNPKGRELFFFFLFFREDLFSWILCIVCKVY